LINTTVTKELDECNKIHNATKQQYIKLRTAELCSLEDYKDMENNEPWYFGREIPSVSSN
jgi:hypothetical protein